MTVMSFNVLCCGVKEYSWTSRKEKVIAAVKKYLPDTIGFQEAHTEWMSYLKENLPEYGYEGMGRDDGKDKGEFSSVFYKRDKYEKLGGGSFWLSERPYEPCVGWDGLCPRTCSWVKLKDRESGQELFHFNTHLDHKGSIARREGARQIINEVYKICKRSDKVIITGDFNSYPAYIESTQETPGDITDPSSEAYSLVTENGFDDARLIAKESDFFHTFHGYSDLSETIDYIFTRNIKVGSFSVIKDKYDGMYPSDHFPIKAEYSY